MNEAHRLRLDPIATPDRLLLGPGPSNADPRVLQAIARPPLSHLDPLYLELMNEVQEMFPDVKMGTMAIPKVVVLLASLTDPTLNLRQLWNLVGRAMPMDNALSRDAYGMVYRPVADTLRDTATPMIEQGWARVKRR